MPISPRRLPTWVRRVVLSANGGYCTYCSSDGTRAEVVDHVEPLEWGGANRISNIVPACRSCNASKRDRTPLQWRPEPGAPSLRPEVVGRPSFP
ncbi:HNH endonuclease [Streptomyces toxytricini]|uniref:HNH endonuclease n=1 Tax=Streptomyces TaxID=1883 RepID=UPI001CC3234C